MAATGFDTLKVSQDLKAAGFNEAQAGAIVRSMAGAFQEMIVTRSDIDPLQAYSRSEFAAARAEIDQLRVSTKSEITAVRTDFAGLRASTKSDIADLEAEVFRALWIQGAGIVGIHLAIGGLLFAAIRFLD
jgi:hypothetical protein